MAPKRGLGKGLDSIIKDKGGNQKVESQVKGAAVLVDIKKIDRNKEQPRKKFKEEELDQLAESIKQHGVLQPLLVQDRKDHYEIVCGERRWRASLKAGLTEVPVIIKDLSEQQIVEISLIENIQREDLDAIEEALAYKRLKTEFNLTDENIAEKVSKSRAAVTNSMRLLKLDARVQQMIIDDKITSGHARSLLAVSDADKQYEIAQEIFDRGLTVREIEKLVKSIDKPASPKKSKDLEKYELQYKEYTDKLTEKLGVKVGVSLKDKNSGKMEIEFYSSDEFEKFYKLLCK